MSRISQINKNSLPARAFAALLGLILSFGILQSNSALAHIENGVLTDEFRIVEVKFQTKGPYKPGDLIAFEVISDLRKSRLEWIQVSADCLTYPAEWHRNTEKKFVNDSYVKKSYAIGIVSSGCYTGEQKIYEVILSDIDNRYARVSIEDSKLPSFYVEGGHLLREDTTRILNSDSLGKFKLPTQIRHDSKSSQASSVTLPRVTAGGQTLDWVITGNCEIKKIAGSSDLGGALLVGSPGTCSISANTPWGSNLYQPFNQAYSMEVFPKSAIKCQKVGKKEVNFYNSKKCPKGYKKIK